MDERTPLERAQIAALAWSLAKQQADDRLARVALADYRGAIQLLKISQPDVLEADPFGYYQWLRRMAAETETVAGPAASHRTVPARPAVPPVRESAY
jgi:hypothetical protein